MTPDQIPELLLNISYADPRILPDDPGERRGKVAMWAGILADVPYDYALQAAQQHYANSPYPLLPADIASQWRNTVRDRLNRHTDPTPATDPDNVSAWRAELLGSRNAVATGRTNPIEYRAITSGDPHPDLAGSLTGIGRYVPDHVRQQLAPYRPLRAEREATVAAGRPDPLSVKCGWCDAPTGEPCRSRVVDPKGAATSNRRRPPHPSRLDAARAAQEPAA
ncbi:zinc finger domain-containing protein [Streptomyces antimycoticus]|uniref:zinc finger domain-containing protein n=1 Tax=Streptomyces antimycoticus TaxID=68175 RepID=UPI0033CF428D